MRRARTSGVPISGRMAAQHASRFLDSPERREAAIGCQLGRRVLKLIQIMLTIKSAQPSTALTSFEVVTGTVRQASRHAGKQAEPFGDVGEDQDR
jgi:hypothetical protein